MVESRRVRVEGKEIKSGSEREEGRYTVIGRDEDGGRRKGREGKGRKGGGVTEPTEITPPVSCCGEVSALTAEVFVSASSLPSAAALPLTFPLPPISPRLSHLASLTKPTSPIPPHQARLTSFTLRNLTHLLHARVSSSLALPYKPCLTCLPHLPASPACLTWAASSFGPRQPSSPRPLKPVATRDSPDGRNDDCMTITSLRPLTDPPSSPAHPHSSHPLPPVLQQPSLPPTPQLPR
ncbi:hypothetical protein E2C01_042044 [Portunus trituberculatus]|uniref:Uncharacterized protein n=1 Tax=Portunus trituberculatus TaxID=210409 RepID=A0A5B7FRZ0_PORTR|nr:hypothetical protein [Portunus trituberculatus]